MNCLIRLRAIHFNDNSICLGRQLKDIVEFLEQEGYDYYWSVADVDALQDINYGVNRRSSKIKNLGYKSDMTHFSNSIHQFISGVFVGSDESIENENQKDIFTEDPEFRDIISACIEIRAFDTSFFEIYSSNMKILEEISKKYGAELNCFDDN